MSSGKKLVPSTLTINHKTTSCCKLLSSLCNTLYLIVFYSHVHLQFSAVLQSEEHISEELQNPSKQSLEVTYTSFTSVQENCLHTKKTHLVLPIPFTACPEFVSDLGKPGLKGWHNIINLRKKVHFRRVCFNYSTCVIFLRMNGNIKRLSLRMNQMVRQVGLCS